MDIEELHNLACKNNQNSYIDPKTGFFVFTENFHRNRGKCCGNKCRHCPYNWENVKTINVVIIKNDV